MLGQIYAWEIQSLKFVDVPSVELGERRLHRVLNSTESYTTAVGPVKVARTLYRSARERAVVPMELRAGIVEGHWTPLAARQASRVVAQMTPSEGEALLRELGNMAPSKSSLDRLPKALSARWEASREAFESALREAAVVPEEAVTVAVSLDGVMVAMKDGKRAEKREHSRAAGRRAKGPAGYQEASCATLSFYDGEGERLDTLSLARMPEPKKATLKTMLSAELDTVLGRRPDLQVVTVADGAHDNWRYLDVLAPEATAVVDFYHAAEQLKSALDARYGENDARGRAQFHKLRHLLLDDPDGVEKVIRALDYQRKKFPRRTRIGEVLRYFRRNRHRMRYADTQARHLPIGSGVVEATCKTLVTQRLKRSGMRWRRPGGQAILTLRALVQSVHASTKRGRRSPRPIVKRSSSPATWWRFHANVPHDESMSDLHPDSLTVSRSAFPALNDGAVEAGMAMLSPVAGFRPWRADRLRVAKLPKPAMVTFSPRASASPMAAKTALTTLSALALGTEVSAATWDASSALFMVPPLAVRSYMRAVCGCGSGCRVAGGRATVGRKRAIVSGAARIREARGGERSSQAA